MNIRRLAGTGLILVAAAIMAYTIYGAVSTVWGVSQIGEMPITVKLFLPVIFGTLAVTLGVMAVQRLRHHRPVDRSGVDRDPSPAQR